MALMAVVESAYSLGRISNTLLSICPFYEDLQSAAIVLENDSGNLSILCSYSPSRLGRFKSRQLKQIINSLSKPITLSADLNAHHVAFGCLQTKPRGTDVYDLLDECDLCILNSRAPTTVGSLCNSQSSIDISYVSPQIAPLCHWSVSDDPMGSYHYPTFTFIELHPQDFEVGQPTDRFLYDKADWKLFASETVTVIWNYIRRFKRASSVSCRPKNSEWIPSFLDKYAPDDPPKEQYGFRKGKSCVESYVALLRDIKDSFHSLSSTVCAFLDVQGAFDNVDPTILVEVLIDIGVPGKVHSGITGNEEADAAARGDPDEDHS